jgi:hypothetical protein
MRRLRGFVCQAGLWQPQMQLQITPLCWGISAAWSVSKISLQLGPVAVAVWFRFRDWQAVCYRFNDPDA